jgi:hypothetical protein
VQAVIVPVDAGPSWLRALSRATPLTYIVDAMRELFAAFLDPGLPAQGLLAAVVVCAVGSHGRSPVDAGGRLTRAGRADS